MGFVETDALTRRGMADMRTLLAQTVNTMPHVWVGVPKKWRRIKEMPTKLPENFLSYAGLPGAVCAGGRAGGGAAG